MAPSLSYDNFLFTCENYHYYRNSVLNQNILDTPLQYFETVFSLILLEYFEIQ